VGPEVAEALNLARTRYSVPLPGMYRSKAAKANQGPTNSRNSKAGASASTSMAQLNPDT
jgi:hypothetical protein